MTVSIEREGSIAMVLLDNPPVNAIGLAMRRALCDAADTLDRDDSVRAVVLLARGRTFIAGADIREFGKPPEPPHLPNVVARLEQAQKPWIAAMHGTALGGGLELALGCHYRVAAGSARLGLPEVTLGIVPGAGGTVRLPRLIPLSEAIRLVTTGKPVPASDAVTLGLIDALVDDDDLAGGARRFAERILDSALPTPLSERQPVERPGSDFWQQQAHAVERRARGQHSPLRALGCIRVAVEQPAREALSYERNSFLELRASDQARALRHVFFAERQATRPPELEGIEPWPLESAAVIGGGTMGAGIVAALCDAGYPVVLVERDTEALERGRQNIERIWTTALERGRIDKQGKAARQQRVRFETDYRALKSVDLVIEAVFEDLEVKQAVFSRLEAVCRPDAMLATNTSYLDPDAIFAAIERKDRVLGLHFFSPANVMKLIEIVPTSSTADAVLASGFYLARQLGKIPVRAGICDGFIGNRILKITRVQAERLLLVGLSPADVDRAMRGFGMPMGPFEAQDLGGLDIAAFQRRAARERGETPFAPVADRLVTMDRLGQKSAGGWYDYEAGKRTPIPSAAVKDIIEAEASAAGMRQRALGDTEIANFIVYPMIEEAARILEEGIAQRSADIDLVQVHGYGFPRWRGGLMFYAEAQGLERIVEALRGMAAEGIADAPCAGLESAAAKGRFDD